MNIESLEKHKKDPVVLKKFKECVKICKGDRFNLVMSNENKDYYIVNLGETCKGTSISNIAQSENDAYKLIVESIEGKKLEEISEKNSPNVFDCLRSKKYGNENGSSYIVAKDFKDNVCAFLQQIYSWAPRGGGTKVDIRLGMFMDDKEYNLCTWNVRDQYDAKRDDESKLYKEIKILENNEKYVFIEFWTWKGEKNAFKYTK